MNASHAITTQASSVESTRLGRPAVSRQARGTLVALATALGLTLAALPASANLLANPGFETPTLLSYGTLLSSPINTVTGVWGQESSAIVTAGSGVTPVQTQMLEMRSDGLGATQAGQFIAVAGSPSMTFSAMFNADLPAAQANVNVTFFSGNAYGTLMGPQLQGAGLLLDANPHTWQPLSVTGAVPVGAQYALAQVFYANASLIDTNGALGMGYVDETFAAAVPEPQTYALMAIGLALVGLKLRRRTGDDGH